jgi:hypothetical protein
MGMLDRIRYQIRIMFMKICGGLDSAFSIDPDPDIVIFNFIYEDVFAMWFLTNAVFCRPELIFLSNYLWLFRIRKESG